MFGKSGLIELDADGVAEGDVLVGVGQESCGHVTAEDLDFVAVAAAAQQITAVGRDVELAGMGCRGLVADAGEQPGPAVDGKDGDALIPQAIARIEEFAVGT